MANSGNVSGWVPDRGGNRWSDDILQSIGSFGRGILCFDACVRVRRAGKRKTIQHSWTLELEIKFDKYVLEKLLLLIQHKFENS